MIIIFNYSSYYLLGQTDLKEKQDYSGNKITLSNTEQFNAVWLVFDLILIVFYPKLFFSKCRSLFHSSMPMQVFYMHKFWCQLLCIQLREFYLSV